MKVLNVKHRRRWCHRRRAISWVDSLWGCWWARECCLATQGSQLCEEKNSCCRAWSAVIRVNGFMSNSFFRRSYAESGMLAHEMNASFSLLLSPSFCAACWLAAGPARSLVHRTFRSTGLLPGWQSKCFPGNEKLVICRKKKHSKKMRDPQNFNKKKEHVSMLTYSVQLFWHVLNILFGFLLLIIIFL